MQLDTSQQPAKITIAGELQTAYPVTTPYKDKRRNKILTAFVVLLLSCSLLVSGSYTFIALDGVGTTSKFVENLKNKYFPSATVTPTEEPTRQYNSETLSYFNSTELSKLGVLALPENYQIQDQYKGIKFVRSPRQSFGQEQLSLLKMFIDRMPAKLLVPGPSAIVTYKNGEIKQGTNFNTNTAAFASGTYIFFNDNSFKPEQPLADDSVDAAFNTFSHEMAHVAQFNTFSDSLTPKAIDSSYEAGLNWIDLILTSDLTESFASVAGWEKTIENKELSFKLTEVTSAKTTTYGKTKIFEDMAETVAGVISTTNYEFSDARVRWALDYLNESEETIAFNKYPFYEKLTAVNANSLQYNKDKETEYKAKYGYSDKQTFIDEKLNTLDDIYNYTSSELKLRGWTGTFKKTADKNNVIRYTGDFVGKDRDMYIEIISYDQAKGYVVKPVGTIVVVISGYIKPS